MAKDDTLPIEDLILVTGGGGFIGSHIAHDLAAAGKRIVVVDLLRSGGKWRNLAGIRLHDLIRPEALFDWLARNGGRVAVVVHMAAISTTSEPDVDRYVASNIRLTLDLWEWCAATGKRFIYASSAATYGDGSAGFVDDESPAALARLQPLNPYGWSKHVVDRRIIDDVRRGLPTPPQWVGLKFFNVYGAHEAHKGPMQSMVAKIAPLVDAGEPVTLFRSHHPQYPDGGQLRDFVYVKDCVAVVRWLVDNAGISGLYNVGSGTARTFLALANAVYQELGREPNIRFVDTPAGLREQYQYFTEADIRKLRAAGFTAPFHTLESGVRDYISGLSQS
ncbi:MAG TPA: ADP-glyceromanno-heptose 6-epimerase [Stellaceae bacterium]|nr:ADP-glyceromanno-heptose 6-epimerase [Stellaceae bacterium]